jgi:hypothetical protein
MPRVRPGNGDRRTGPESASECASGSCDPIADAGERRTLRWGKWIRTFGPSQGMSQIRTVGAERDIGRRKRRFLYGGTDGSNPVPSTGESLRTIGPSAADTMVAAALPCFRAVPFRTQWFRPAPSGGAADLRRRFRLPGTRRQPSEKLFRRRRLILPKTVRCRPEVDADHAWLTPVKADSDVAMLTTQPVAPPIPVPSHAAPDRHRVRAG